MKLDKNAVTASKLGLVALCMFGFGYALVPLYNVFCEVAGINGKTGEISISSIDITEADLSRSITVEFVTSVNSELPWEFKPMERRVSIHPGQLNEAVFVVENASGSAITGQAVPSVAPQKASIYFNKTECFCFTQQRLEAGETRDMPVRFIVDPDLPDDIHVLTLSYTFFKSPGVDPVVSVDKHAAKTKEKS